MKPESIPPSTVGVQPVIAAGIILITAIFYFYLTWHTEYVDFLSDSAIYLLMASYFGGEVQIPVEVFDVVWNEYHLPPTFPIVLSLLGGGADYPFASHVINTTLVITAIIFFLAWLRSQGEHWVMAMGLCCAFALLPVSLYFANFIVSEYLYIIFVFLSLLMLNRSTPNDRLVLLAATLIGVTVTVRPIGVALLPVLLLALRTHSKKQISAALMLAAAAPALWFVYKLQFSASNYFSSFLHSHGDQIVTSIVTYAKINLHVLGLSWVKSFDYHLGTHAVVACTVIGSLAIIGWGKRLLHLKLDAVYLTVYLLIIIPWPHPDHMQRFLLPLMPFMLLYGVEGIRTILRTPPRTSVQRLVVGGYFAMIAVLALPTDIRLVDRLTTPLPLHLSSFSRSQAWLFSRDSEAAMHSILFSKRIYESIANTSAVPAEECIWSIDAPRHMLLSKRASYGTPRPALNSNDFIRAAQKCRYFFAIRAVPHPNHSRYTSLYPIERLKNQATIVQRYRDDELGLISLLLKAAKIEGDS